MATLRHNTQMDARPARVIVLPEANSGLPLKGDFERMARRRYQRGQLLSRGTKHPVWIGRWREDIIQDGRVQRVQKWEILGTKEDYPTRKLALRALEDRLSNINNVSYRPRPVAKFKDFAEKWQRIVLPNLNPHLSRRFARSYASICCQPSVRLR